MFKIILFLFVSFSYSYNLLKNDSPICSTKKDLINYECAIKENNQFLLNHLLKFRYCILSKDGMKIDLVAQYYDGYIKINLILNNSIINDLWINKKSLK